MVHQSKKRSRTKRVVGATGRFILRVVVVALGSLSAIGSAGAKPALPPEVVPSPNEYRP
jgi:hypothetical protein